MPARSRVKKPAKAVAVPRRIVASLAWKVALVLATCLVVYTIYLDAVIRSSFSGKKWQLPARVYARPLELYQGLALRPEEFQQELDELGYRSAAPTRPGSYQRSGDSFDLYSREFVHADTIEPARQVSLRFDRGHLLAMQSLAGDSLPLMRLDPVEIGAIYPSHREDRILLKLQDVRDQHDAVEDCDAEEGDEADGC